MTKVDRLAPFLPLGGGKGDRREKSESHCETQFLRNGFKRRKSMRNLILVGGVVLVVCAFGLADSTLQAQPFPNRLIQLVIPMGPGTATDIHGRVIAEELKKILKTEIVVVNKPGASQTTGTDAVVKSKKDGYTLLYAGGGAIVAH